MANSIRIINANIIDENGSIHTDKEILIEDGLIMKICNKGGAAAENGEVIDAKGGFVTPGFVNLHTHSPMNIFRGIAEDVNIDDWFNREIWPFESKMTAEDVYLGAKAAICEMIENGVTAFADHYFHAQYICDAVLETGIRADIAPTVFGLGEDFEAQLKSAADIVREKSGISSRLKLRMGPHAPYTCPGEKLEQIVDAAKALGTGIHIHVSETLKQVEDSLESLGKTPFEVLSEAGGFDIPCIIGHGLWIEENDRGLLGKQTYMAACPKTYMKLAMGHGHIWDRSAELPLCIGTDGSASSNAQNPLEQARLFALTGKFIKNDPEGYDLEFMWKMLMRGHKALDFNSGRMVEGAAADLLIWQLDELSTLPLFNPLAAIFYSAESRHITHVMVEGRLLKKDGALTIDTGKLRIKLKEAASSLLMRGKGVTNLRF